MRRYYFDLHNWDGLSVDQEGVELATDQSAQEEAARTMADMVRDAMRSGEPPLDLPHRLFVEVRSASGRILMLKCTIEIESQNW
jgi:hypothetical protein